MKKRPVCTLDSFVKRIKVDSDTSNYESAILSASTSAIAGSSIENKTQEPLSNSNANEANEDSQQRQPDISFSDDIGEYVGLKKLTDSDKYRILKEPFVPDRRFNFPHSLHKKNNDIKCYLSSKHFECFSWLTYSVKKGGLFCKLCAIFAQFGGVNKSAPLNKLVITPLSKYSKLFGKDGDLTLHDQCKYHREAIENAQNFIETYENPKKEVLNILDTKRIKQINENRARLRPIIETINYIFRAPKYTVTGTQRWRRYCFI